MISLGCLVIASCVTPTEPVRKTYSKGEKTRFLEPPHTQSYREYLKGPKLVAVQKYAPGIQISLMYATSKNVAGRRLYPTQMACRLDESTARKLGKAQAELSKLGLGLKVWDAYRPFRVQQELFKAANGSVYVADPNLWTSKHCSGRAVDVTLVDLKTGREMRMPTGFDEFSENASSHYRGSDPVVRKNVHTLQSAMRQAGFRHIDMEWWHFDNPEFYEYNIPAL
jgi:D-alanyl-D-alanine dipeptidase